MGCKWGGLRPRLPESGSSGGEEMNGGETVLCTLLGCFAAVMGIIAGYALAMRPGRNAGAVFVPILAAIIVPFGWAFFQGFYDAWRLMDGATIGRCLMAGLGAAAIYGSIFALASAALAMLGFGSSFAGFRICARLKR
jgi:hypothetical protein